MSPTFTQGQVGQHRLRLRLHQSALPASHLRLETQLLLSPSSWGWCLSGWGWLPGQQELDYELHGLPHVAVLEGWALGPPEEQL